MSLSDGTHGASAGGVAAGAQGIAAGGVEEACSDELARAGAAVHVGATGAAGARWTDGACVEAVEAGGGGGTSTSLGGLVLLGSSSVAIGASLSVGTSSVGADVAGWPHVAVAGRTSVPSPRVTRRTAPMRPATAAMKRPTLQRLAAELGVLPEPRSCAGSVRPHRPPLPAPNATGASLGPTVACCPGTVGGTPARLYARNSGCSVLANGVGAAVEGPGRGANASSVAAVLCSAGGARVRAPSRVGVSSMSSTTSAG